MPCPSEPLPQGLSSRMKAIGGMREAYRGLSPHAVMSPEVQLACFRALEAMWGGSCLLVIEGQAHRWHKPQLFLSSGRMLVWVNLRHWASVRSSGGTYLLVDTVWREDAHMARRSAEVLDYLSTRVCPGAAWAHDEAAPQQEAGRGGKPPPQGPSCCTRESKGCSCRYCVLQFMADQNKKPTHHPVPKRGWACACTGLTRAHTHGRLRSHEPVQPHAARRGPCIRGRRGAPARFARHDRLRRPGGRLHPIAGRGILRRIPGLCGPARGPHTCSHAGRVDPSFFFYS